MAVPCSRKTPSLPAETSPETPREDYEDLLLLLTTKELFLLAQQHNYRSCRKTAPSCWFNN